MTRQNSFTAKLCFLCTLLFSSVAFAQIDLSVPMDHYFPFYTAQFTSIPDVARMSNQFDQTDIGILAAQPNMKPFQDSISEQVSSGPLKDRLGITLNDLRNVANGEVAFGTIYPNKELLAIALMANISNHAAEANQLVNKVSANVQQKRGRVVRNQVGTALFVQLDFVDDNGKNQKIVYIIDGDLLVVCDNLMIAKLLWQKASNNPAVATVKPISASAYYQMIKRHSSPKSESFSFVQIDRYAEAVQLLDDKYSAGNLTSKSPVESLKKSGLIGFRAAGGSLQLKPGPGFNRFVKGYVYAPKPWEGSMKMYQLVNVPCPEPPAWISSKISTYTAIQGTPELVFDNIAPFFDTYFGEGEQGVWSDVVEGLETDPMGPQINLKKDLVQYFDGQLLVISQALEPLGPNSECIAYALRVKDVNAIRSALNRLFNGDPTIKPDKIGQFNIWQCVPKPKKTSPFKPGPISSAQAKKEKPEGMMAHAAIAVENGYLIISSNRDYLAQLLTPTAQPLKDSVGYKRTMAVAKQRCGDSACVWVYSPTENNYRLNYELYKDGKAIESNTMLTRIIKAISGTDKPKTQQTNKVDASSLPPFDQIKSYFGTSGGFSKIENDGFSFEEFVLSNRQ
ncbi:MAG: hypothetical protein IJQ39_14605 [Thermoguttaceae bacterium]|nr:hypothetical protein [Thermoguttaceae bacterium]